MSNDTCDKDACISAVGTFFFQTEGDYEHTSKVGILKNHKSPLKILLSFLSAVNTKIAALEIIQIFIRHGNVWKKIHFILATEFYLNVLIQMLMIGSENLEQVAVVVNKTVFHLHR